jgi:mRNA-degrading endonuclease toxin of MazEF toxin-antitoxin module
MATPFEPDSLALKGDQTTGLSKDSVADAMQVKSVSLDRFERRLGHVSATDIEEIASAVQLVIEG